MSSGGPNQAYESGQVELSWSMAEPLPAALALQKTLTWDQ